MEGLLSGKVVVITGAGSGVGAAATLLFTQHGAKVLATDLDLASAQASAQRATEAGGVATAFACDVTEAASVDAAIAAAVERYGRLDVMYNNAGITTPPGRPTRFVETDNAELERLERVNVGGVANGCRSAIRQFTAQGGGGVIVNTASVVGLIGWGSVLYGSTKGALTTLTRALAMELAPQGIRINSVCPAAMLTKFGIGGAGPVSDQVKESMDRMHPLGRVIDPMDCAQGALFLASDLASNITGVNLPVDGGLSAGR